MARLKYRGMFHISTSYDVGDVVTYSDGLVYYRHTGSGSGVYCPDTRNWQRLFGELAEAVLMMYDVQNLAATETNSKISSRIKNDLTTTTSGYALDARQGKALSDAIMAISPSNKILKLMSSTAGSSKMFNITVDDDGELTATEVS